MTAAERTSMTLRSLLLQSAFGPERMQGLGFAWALDRWLSKVWSGDARALAEARKRHLHCFNTNPYASGFVLGLTARLEEEAAAAPASARGERLARLSALRAAASAGLSGAADSFFWGALRPALAFACLLLAGLLHRFGGGAWPLLAAAAYLLAWNAPALYARTAGLARGYAGGEKAVLEVCRIPAAEAARSLRLAAIGLGVALAFAGLYAAEIPETARLWGGAGFLLAAALSARVGPWGVAAGLGALRAVWEAGL